MATINDFGGVGNSLATPALGGPSGWAAAVRDDLVSLRQSPNIVAAGQWHYSSYQTGQIYNATGALIGRAHATPYYAPERITVSRIAYWLSVAGNTGNVFRIGIYTVNPTTGAPGNPLSDQTIPCDGAPTGERIMTLTTPVVVPRGLWYIVLVEQGSGTLAQIMGARPTHAFLASGNTNPATPGFFNGSDSSSVYWRDDITGALPSGGSWGCSQPSERAKFLAYWISAVG